MTAIPATGGWPRIPPEARGVPVWDHLSPTLHDPVPTAVVRRRDRNDRKVVQVRRTERAVVPRVAERVNLPVAAHEPVTLPVRGCCKADDRFRDVHGTGPEIVGVPEGKNATVRANEPVPVAVGGCAPLRQSAAWRASGSCAPEVPRIAIGQDPAVRPDEPVTLAVRRGGHSDNRGSQVRLRGAAEEPGRTVASTPPSLNIPVAAARSPGCTAVPEGLVEPCACAVAGWAGIKTIEAAATRLKQTELATRPAASGPHVHLFTMGGRPPEGPGDSVLPNAGSAGPGEPAEARRSG